MGLKNGTFILTVDIAGELVIQSINAVNINSDIEINLNAPSVNCSNSLGCGSGANGVFKAGDKTVTVSDGIITSIG